MRRRRSSAPDYWSKETQIEPRKLLSARIEPISIVIGNIAAYIKPGYWEGFRCAVCICASILGLAAFATFTATGSQGAPGAAPSSLDALAQQSLAAIDGNLKVPGLKQPVEIIRDSKAFPIFSPRTRKTCSSPRAM